MSPAGRPAEVDAMGHDTHGLAQVPAIYKPSPAVNWRRVNLPWGATRATLVWDGSKGTPNSATTRGRRGRMRQASGRLGGLSRRH